MTTSDTPGLLRPGDGVGPTTGRRTGPVQPSAGATTRLRPLAAPARVTGGFWGDRLEMNHSVSIPYAFEQLERAGNFHDLRLAAGSAAGEYRALGPMFDGPFPFLDSDVYKWLEAVGWELGRAPDAHLAGLADEAIALVQAAQREDGYLNSFVQVLGGGRPYRDPRWGHELYTLGHLVQAAVAWVRAVGDERLLRVVERAVAHVERELGPGGRDGIDGHPLIEMALVELYRTTGERRHLELARRMLVLRGRGLLAAGQFGDAYWQDHRPVREAPLVAGHVVRQLYLDCGAVDVAVETGDAELLGAVVTRWEEMVATRTYLTGGLGSRHRDESFGNPYELPPDRAYAETCASIASVMLAWRLLLATGRPDCADVVERTVLNGVMSGISLDGRSFFYVNPLQRRDGPVPASPGEGVRAGWFPCSCCPPNLMRTFSSWGHYLATTDPDGVQLHQYATAELAASLEAGRVRLAMETAYPFDGRIAVRVIEAPDSPWSLALRVPAWCRDARLAVGAEAPRQVAGEGVVEVRRPWVPGDEVVLELAMPPRLTAADPRIDAVRGCVAIERGPLVYCVESADQPAGAGLDGLEVPRQASLADTDRSDLGPGIVGVTVRGQRRDLPPSGSPYPPAGTADDGDAPATPVDIPAIPYFAWANRSPGTMRVFLPSAAASAADC